MVDETADETAVVGDLAGEEAVWHAGFVHGVDGRAIVLTGDGILEYDGVGGGVAGDSDAGECLGLVL